MILGAPTDGAFNVGSNGEEVALNADGSRAYVAAGAPYSFTVYDASSAAAELPVLANLAGSPYPSSIQFGADDRIYGAANVLESDPVDVWVYDQAGNPGPTFDLGGGVRRLAISGEALRMTALTASSLLFVTIPPP